MLLDLVQRTVQQVLEAEMSSFLGAETCPRGDGFSRSGLAHQRQRLAWVNGKTQVIDGRVLPRIGGKRDRETVHAEKKLHGLILVHGMAQA
ncbi:MAG: hypothetical protein ACYCO5_04150 [Acidobacteriaceae bacterium]